MSYSPKYCLLRSTNLINIIIFLFTFKMLFPNHSIFINYCHLLSYLQPILPLLFNITYLFLILLLLITCGDVELNPGPLCNFKIAHINSRSINAPSRLNDIETLLVNYHNFDIISVTETHLDHTIKDNDIELNNYRLFRKDRTRMGGGVAIYVN